MRSFTMEISEDCVVLDFGFGRVRVMHVSEDVVQGNPECLSTDIETPLGSRVRGTWADRKEIDGYGSPDKPSKNTPRRN